ncbi:hypothetical protein E4U50_007989 [Claviceps purpurea]|nr:hypothetical protein E4U12_007952 [Claviceps purpurea]KAG6185862.1 hypothetical protein E4U36_001051 [Claviceps purpurea]KAG6197097.1 hypothetical protein E4U50_007989 [Claviceps purpurea]
MRFTILLGLSAAVSALPLDGSDKSLLSDSTSSGPKLPNYIFSNFKKSVGNTEDVRERSPLPEAEKVVVNAAN